MTESGLILLGLPAALLLYAYVGYPALLALLGARSRSREPVEPSEWPRVSVSLPAHDEEAVIRDTLEAWLVVDYPRDRLQILVISDASTDRTDEIVGEFGDRGIELLRVEDRGGKTAAENAAIPRLRGEIVINTDASTRVLPDSVKPLIRAFKDPEVGVASGRDVSTGSVETAENDAERGYVGYEMWVRDLETRSGSIVGASGCFYAIRQQLHQIIVPDTLSRDFASALTAREHGYRAISVRDAVCLVPRTGSLRGEFHRKVRTMARGLATLWYKRKLLNPFRQPDFAFRLFSHKLCRWLLPLTLPLALIGLLILSLEHRAAFVALALSLLGLAAGAAGLLWPRGRKQPRLIAVAGYALGANVAAVVAWVRAIRGRRGAIWEPTRRQGIGSEPANPA